MTGRRVLCVSSDRKLVFDNVICRGRISNPLEDGHSKQSQSAGDFFAPTASLSKC